MEHTFTTSNAVNTFVRAGNDDVWGCRAGQRALEIHAKRRPAYVDFGVESRLVAAAEATKDEFTVRVMGPAPATNAFILTNAARNRPAARGSIRLLLSAFHRRLSVLVGRRSRDYFGAGFTKTSSATGALIFTSVSFSVVT